ncbi:unnamed protein product [Periconia digitata]|uniref:Amidase domain-containing protein n=1 Tax=Periconia digitata TaxID=1303443 RepID=A0A9W4UMC4_9PLEO|nr:unnamed protein product [Periconia digitata]
MTSHDFPASPHALSSHIKTLIYHLLNPHLSPPARLLFKLRLPSTMSQQPLHTLTATQALNLLRNDTITVEEYARALLRRINERDDVVKAWAFLDAAVVIQQAEKLDQLPRNKRGPLHGVAVNIKDFINTRDMPTQYGSALYKGHQSGFDASVVGVLRTAGALIFGKTTTTEFTVANSGPDTTNPRDPIRTPGGSSCGSAAAVADWQVPLSLGTQTGGSVIRPASYNGVFGLKPSWGVIGTEGVKNVAVSFDTVGVFARSVEDLQLFCDVFGIADDGRDFASPTEDMNVAVVRHGVRVNAVDLPQDIGESKAIEEMCSTIIAHEAAPAFLHQYRLDKTRLGPSICRIVENSANITHVAYTHAANRLFRMRTTLNAFLGEYTVVITPSAVDEAPVGLHDMGSAVFNTLWTGVHVPVINIPAFEGLNGMPVGVSLVAGRYRDRHLLRVAEVLGGSLIDGVGWKGIEYA